MPASRITLQRLEPPTELFPIPGVDAIFRGAGDSLPPAILLDYMYGAAAYHRWRDGDIPEFMKDYHAEHYENIPLLPQSMPSSYDGSGDESDDARDGDYGPRTPPTQRYHAHRHHDAKYSAMVESMDNMNAFIMSLQGYRPGERYAQQQRREEEASRIKVEDWLQGSIPEKGHPSSSRI